MLLESGQSQRDELRGRRGAAARAHRHEDVLLSFVKVRDRVAVGDGRQLHGPEVVAVVLVVRGDGAR